MRGVFLGSLADAAEDAIGGPATEAIAVFASAVTTAVVHLNLPVADGVVVIMDDIDHSIEVLGTIRAMGVTVAVDDFGTGFSSLGYVARLPIDSLKIDQSFVAEMMNGSTGLSLVSTIIALGHSLKLKVVAEGVETEEQSQLLRSLRCDEMQGYLFSRAVSGDVFESRFLALASTT